MPIMDSRISIAPPHAQQGAAALIMMIIVVVGASYYFLGALNRASSQVERDRITVAALAQAKEALIGYAASVTVTASSGLCGANCPRPGDLPCPDTNNDGEAESSCGNAAGTTGQEKRLGRLPWKTLGLPDLRDGYGERLWYAVSNNFKNNFRAPQLNSDTFGTITVRSSTGTMLNNGTDSSATIAVILSSGSVLMRQDARQQDRSCSRGGVPDPVCQASEVCTTPNPTTTAKCNPTNYLDILKDIEDNADFADGNTNGFINGEVLDANRNPIVNDKLITVAYGDLMPLLEKRVAGEALSCLTEYATRPQNQGHYPWAATLDTSVPPDYNDDSGALFGRLPDAPFINTRADSGDGMDNNWTGTCNINPASGWWPNWKEMVFYAVANACKPMAAAGCSGTFLTVTPPPSAPDPQVVVIVAGRRLAGVAGGQPRGTSAEKGTTANYLEGNNQSGIAFQQGKATSTFNDSLGYR
jgi:hypothetical protein